MSRLRLKARSFLIRLSRSMEQTSSRLRGTGVLIQSQERKARALRASYSQLETLHEMTSVYCTFGYSLLEPEQVAEQAEEAKKAILTLAIRRIGLRLHAALSEADGTPLSQ